MTAWLPLMSALVIGAVTLVSVWINNRTNRAAIAATDEREHRKWQRDVVIRQCAAATQEAHAAIAEANNFSQTRNRYDQAQLQQFRSQMVARAQVIWMSAESLRIADAQETANACMNLFDAVLKRAGPGEPLHASTPEPDLTVPQSPGSNRPEFDGGIHSRHSVEIALIREAIFQLTNIATLEVGRLDTSQGAMPSPGRFRRARRRRA